MAAQSDCDVNLRTLIILAFSATAGVFAEFYDFFIYGYAAASAFPAIFFPKLPPTQALLFSYLAFGAGFPARLVGAFLFGHFGDRTGRKYSFLLNIAMVGVATCLTGLLPGYATLGIAAPVLLVLLRIVQGIGLGGAKTHAHPILLLALVVSFVYMDGYVTGTYFISFMRFAGIPSATTATILILTFCMDSPRSGRGKLPHKIQVFRHRHILWFVRDSGCHAGSLHPRGNHRSRRFS